MGEVQRSEAPVLNALQNELVLEKIFKYLPVKSLLECSEVCKLWNNQVRTYIRDHRKCTVSISSTPPCNRLKELDQVIGNMNIVPFNSLEFHLDPHEVCLFCQTCGRCSKKTRYETPDDDDLLNYENLLARLKVKHLAISINREVYTCPAMCFMLRLLLEKRKEIKDLRVMNISPAFVDSFRDKHDLELLSLETLQVGIPQIRKRFDMDWVTQELLGKILHGGTPKLKQIFDYTFDRKFTNNLPTSKYRLLSNYRFNQEHVAQAVLLADSHPTLSELTVHILWVTDHQPPLEYSHTVQSLIQSSFKSIVRLELSPLCFAKALSFPPLENLISLTVGSCGDHEETKNALHSIELGRLFPNLQKVEFHGNDDNGMSYRQGIPLEVVAPHPEFDSVEEVEYHPNSPYASQTTSDLIIRADISSLSFVNLKKSLPEVVDILIYADFTNAHTVPYRQIFRLWPNLKRLHVRAVVLHQLPNCDAEFCGINQEEVELLWSMDDEYLRNVHIVPVRPCVTTMNNLESIAFWFALKYDLRSMRNEPRFQVLSSVTNLLVFQRMPWLKFTSYVQSLSDENCASAVFDIGGQ